MGAIGTADLVDVLGIEAPSETRLMAAKPKERRKGAAPDAATHASWTERNPSTAATYSQGNWKRRPGVATRHELVLAIDRLIAHGLIEVANGELRTTKVRGEKREPVSAAERWRRADEELRAYCEEMHVSETRTTRYAEAYAVQSQGGMFEATMLRSEPRRAAGKYVLRELRHPTGARGYEAVIDAIFVLGGWEWVNEDAEEKRTAKARRKARRAA